MPKLRDQIETIIREELADKCVVVEWDIGQIQVTPKSIIESTHSAGSLSNALIEHFIPAATTDVELAHFTSIECFRSIADSNELWLHPLIGKIGEAEFTSFCEDFGLSGYFDKKDGEPYYKTRMKDLFYISFTSPEPQDPKTIWDRFGKQAKGVKLTVQVSPIESRSELRRVRYSSELEAARSIIKSIMRRVEDECDRHFIMRGISKVGAFYLPLGRWLEVEEETRLLLEAYEDSPAGDLILRQSDRVILPLALGCNGNKFCALRIVSVQPGPECDEKDIKEIKRIHSNSRFSEVPLGDV